jgi:hypothetical protein
MVIKIFGMPKAKAELLLQNFRMHSWKIIWHSVFLESIWFFKSHMDSEDFWQILPTSQGNCVFLHFISFFISILYVSTFSLGWIVSIEAFQKIARISMMMIPDRHKTVRNGLWWYHDNSGIIKQLALFKLSLSIKHYLQRTQKLQLNEIENYL